MNNSEVAVRIKHLNKTYMLFDTPLQRMRSLLFGGKGGKKFVALDDITVNIRKGEAFAIIGKNGSGKSTMLQILAGIIRETSGNVEVNGKVAALLELGSGFDPESTGYENIYMNAAILGASKEEIDRKLQDIIEFADIGEHLYQPVKTYSSGMYIRLGFAVAINVDAEILLVDEALAVGDVFFRQKCYSKLNELKKNGTTIILVTHNMGEVEQFCDRALLLNKSRQIAVGQSNDVVKQYYILNDAKDEADGIVLGQEKRSEEGLQKDSGEELHFEDGFRIREPVFFDLEKASHISNGKADFIKVGLFDGAGEARRTFEQGEWGYFYCEIQIGSDIDMPSVGFLIRNHMGILVHGKDTIQMGVEIPERIQAGKKVYFIQKICFNIEVGEYTVSSGISSIHKKDYAARGSLLQEELNEKFEHICDVNGAGAFNIILKHKGTPTRMGFYGNCDLPGSGQMIVK